MSRKRNKYQHLLGTEVLDLDSDRPCFVAAIDPKKGITIKHLDDQTDSFCLNRSYFPPGQKGDKQFKELFETMLVWISFGELKWNASISIEGEITIFPISNYCKAEPGYCAFA